MKKILLFALSLLVVVACSKFDDSAIWEELNKHEDRIVKLETLCNQMNTNIASLQTIIIALQSNDYVVNIAPIMEGNKEIGYTITFAKSGSITIYHGKDGENGKDGVNGADGKDGQDGKDGVNGKDGKDGYTPEIGVKQHTDGKYYWTLDGNWLLDDSGNMIPTTGENGKDGANGTDGRDGQDGTDGRDGQDGKDGITPQLKIEDGYWYLSYDNGATWQKLGKATGSNGLDGANGADGEDGDSIIDSITQDEENVYFNLSDGTLITLPKRNTDTIVFEDLNVKAICCKQWDTNFDGEFSYNEAAIVSNIGSAFQETNIIAFSELKYFTGITIIPTGAFKNCTSLWKITLPQNIESIESSAFSGCKNLSHINIPDQIISIGSSAFNDCESLRSVDFPNTLTMIESWAFANCKSLTSIRIPDGVASIGSSAFNGCTSVTNVYVGSGVIELGYRPFDGITGDLVYNSIIPDGTHSGYGYYSSILHDTDFDKITIGGRATKIGSYAFSVGDTDNSSNSRLKVLVIDKAVKIIGAYAAYTSTLDYVYCKSTTPPTGAANMFYSYLNKIYVPIGASEAYKSAEYWKNYASKIQEYDFDNNPIP